MERLTSRLPDGTVTIKRDGVVRDASSNYMFPSDIAAVRRLAAYEDTGLTPERCAELAEADKEGRLVMLPCKVGDTVYFAAWFGTHPHIVKRVIEPYFYTDDTRGQGSSADFSLRDFGKTVFLTREEAEQALMEGPNDEF